MTEDERYQRARSRVMQLKAFYFHLLTYVVVIAGLFLINLLTSPRSWWFYWPALGWGIAVAIHALATFYQGFLGRDWEERKTREYMDKDQAR